MQTTRPTHAKRLITSIGLVVSTVGLGGCPNDDTTETSDGTAETGGDTQLLPGDLVITEIAANPPGDDKGFEWFEIYNASGSTIDLEGVTLVLDINTHTIARSVELPAGGYVVVGSMLDEFAVGSDLVDYGYGEDLGLMDNDGGLLAIQAGNTIIDQITTYIAADDTASAVLDGATPPDALLNDDNANWCYSTTELVEGYAATPGAINDACAGATTCKSGDTFIDVIHPQVGDLIFTEVMPNPSSDPEDPQEWWELHSLANADFHLNGLEFGKVLGNDALEVINSPDCITVAPGDYMIIARSLVDNGGLPAESIVWEVQANFDLSLDGALWAGVDGELIDAVTWSSPDDGIALQLRPGAFDPIDNDNEDNWCNADVQFGDGGFGTPGAENTMACPLPEPPEGQCYEAGELRDIMPLAMTDLELTEVMFNPDRPGGEGPAEWFEALAHGSGDLNGLGITKLDDVFEPIAFPGECVTVNAGDYIVFAHDVFDDGGPPNVDVLFNNPSALNNTNSNVAIGYAADVFLDQTPTWTSITDGHAWSKDLQTDEWCEAVTPFEDVLMVTQYGTPGMANPACGGGPGAGCIDPDTNLMRMFNPPMPGELTLSEIMPNPSGGEPTAEWFEIYTSGSFDLNGVALGKADAVQYVFSSPDCLEVSADTYLVFARTDVPADNCGLPVDYVYTTLALTNSNSNLQVGLDMDADDLFDVVLDEHMWGAAGNGVALSHDMTNMLWCDAVDPFGCGDLGTPGMANPDCAGNNMGMCFDAGLMMMRPPVKPVAGDLVITEFMANPDPTPDADGEWFEVRALGSFDLNGLHIGRDYMVEGQNPLHVISDANCLSMSPNDLALFARDADPMLNGNLPMVDYVFPFGLTNSNSGLYIASDVELLDQIAWTAVGTGRSTSLDPGSYDPLLNDVANNAAPWCYMVLAQETPRADNLACP